MICRWCYREIADASAFCPRCGARQGDVPAAAPQAADGGGAPEGNPWERRAGRGAVDAFGETLQESLFRPGAFFRATTPEGNVGAALLWAIVVGTLSWAVALMWYRVLNAQIAVHLGEWLGPAHVPRQFWYSALVSLPATIFASTVVWAGVLHASLTLVGGARGGYAATLKSVCYAFSALIFNVFPFCGWPVGVAWLVILQIVGLRELHRTTTARALWAWFLPALALSCLVLMLASAVLIGIAKFWHLLDGGGFEV